MKIFIISSPNIVLKHTQHLKRRFFAKRSFRTTIFPIGIAALTTVLINDGHEVKVLDCLVEDKDLKEIIDDIESFQPDFVLLSPFDRCRWGLEGAISIANFIKNGKVVLFGSYVKELMVWVMENNQGIDYAVYGDPEEALKELVSGEDKESIKGLIFRKGKEIVENESRYPIDINDLPIANRNLLRMERYKKLPHVAVKEPCIDVMTTRGCPYDCSFCLLKIVGGKNYRARSPEKVIEEIKLLKEKHGAKQINFDSLNFTVDREWVKNLCELLIKENLGIIWSCQTRTDLIDKEILEMMKKAGCVSILYGVESFSQELLDNINKKMDFKLNYEAIRLTKEVGIEVRVSMMLGLPGETPQMVEKTVNELIKLGPDFVQFHATIAFPFTALYEKKDKWGKISGIKDKSFDISGHPFLPEGYKNEDELKKVISRAYCRFYLRPRYIIKKIFNFKEWGRYLKGVLVLLNVLKK